MQFVHSYLNDELGFERFLCEAYVDKDLVGYCCYYKPELYNDQIYIEYINIYSRFRRQGYGTKIVIELNNKYNLKWDGKFTECGLKFYKFLVEKSIVKD